MKATPTLFRLAAAFSALEVSTLQAGSEKNEVHSIANKLNERFKVSCFPRYEVLRVIDEVNGRPATGASQTRAVSSSRHDYIECGDSPFNLASLDDAHRHVSGGFETGSGSGPKNQLAVASVRQVSSGNLIEPL
jgi:hypothetical protein